MIVYDESEFRYYGKGYGHYTPNVMEPENTYTLENVRYIRGMFEDTPGSHTLQPHPEHSDRVRRRTRIKKGAWSTAGVTALVMSRDIAELTIQTMSRIVETTPDETSAMIHIMMALIILVILVIMTWKVRYAGENDMHAHPEDYIPAFSEDILNTVYVDEDLTLTRLHEHITGYSMEDGTAVLRFSPDRKVTRWIASEHAQLLGEDYGETTVKTPYKDTDALNTLIALHRHSYELDQAEAEMKRMEDAEALRTRFLEHNHGYTDPALSQLKALQSQANRIAFSTEREIKERQMMTALIAQHTTGEEDENED